MLVLIAYPVVVSVFFFTATATTEIYTLSLHDSLPISGQPGTNRTAATVEATASTAPTAAAQNQPVWPMPTRSEEHTSELQSQSNLVCRLLLEKRKKIKVRLILTAYRAGQHCPDPPLRD